MSFGTPVEGRTGSSLAHLEKLHQRYALRCDESAIYDTFLVPERARGMWVWMRGDPEPYLDLVLGYSSLNFGHDHPAIRAAVGEALSGVWQLHSVHNAAQLELSRLLVERLAPGERFRVYFDVGGSNVVSAALRLCRHHTGRRRLLCFGGAFHGTGFAAAAVSDPRLLDPGQYGGNPLCEEVVRLPFPCALRGPSLAECVAALERALSEAEPAAVIVEPVQGANGFAIPAAGFLEAVRRLTEAHRVPLVADDIQVGVGRTGRLYAIHHAGVTPDISLLSKSLSGGFHPISALIAREELFDGVPARGTAFQATFNNNPLGALVGLRALQLAEREGLFENAAARGADLLRDLRFVKDYGFAAHLRGVGLAIAFDVVGGGGRGASGADLARSLVHTGLDHHVLLYACGTERNVIKIAPPITATAEDCALIRERLRACLDAFAEGLE